MLACQKGRRELLDGHNVSWGRVVRRSEEEEEEEGEEEEEWIESSHHAWTATCAFDLKHTMH